MFLRLRDQRRRGSKRGLDRTGILRREDLWLSLSCDDAPCLWSVAGARLRIAARRVAVANRRRDAQGFPTAFRLIGRERNGGRDEERAAEPFYRARREALRDNARNA